MGWRIQIITPAGKIATDIIYKRLSLIDIVGCGGKRVDLDFGWSAMFTRVKL